MTSPIDLRCGARSVLRAVAGFTLVELLIVIVIIGVMAFLVAPAISTGSDYARLKAASRGVVQLSRYSRTMALLRQTPVELVFSSDGKLRVAGGAVGGEKLISDDAFARTNLADEAEEIITPALKDAPEADAGGGSAYQMADLEIEKEYEGITFRFEGFSDTMDDGSGIGSFPSALPPDTEGDADSAGDSDAASTFKVQYRSNGTCRPYRVRIVAGSDDLEFKVVEVNMLGFAKILDEDDL